MEHTDKGLIGNEQIEKAILALQQEPTQDRLAHTLTILRQRMRKGGQVIVAVEPNISAGRMDLKTIQTPDGGSWFYAFTGFDESLKGAEKTKSTFLCDLGQLLDMTLDVSQVRGVILNPWNRTIQLDKALIQIIKGQ